MPGNMSNSTDYSNHPVSTRSSFSNDLQIESNWGGFYFESSHLEELYTTAQNGERFYSKAVVKAFFKQMAFIRSVTSEQDLYGIRSLRFHRLEGDRSNEYSVRLTGNWRLITRFDDEDSIRYLVVLRIEDYH